MARCEGTTRNGEQCKLDARPGSRYCHLHHPVEGENGENEAKAGTAGLDWDDVLPLLLAGAVAAGLLFFLRSFGRWIPRM